MVIIGSLVTAFFVVPGDFIIASEVFQNFRSTRNDMSGIIKIVIGGERKNVSLAYHLYLLGQYSARANAADHREDTYAILMWYKAVFV